MRVGTLQGLLLVSSLIVGCTTPGASKPPENVALSASTPSVTERPPQEIEAIWERCRAQPEKWAAITPPNARATVSPQELGNGPGGSLSKEQIRATVETRIEEVRVCYEQALTTVPSLSGRVVTNFVIAGDGSVMQATVAEAPPDLSGAGTCIVERIRHWTFPRPDNGGVVVVTYPFVLEPEDAKQADADAARTVFDAHLNDFRRCYARALVQQPTAAGVVGVRVGIAPTGKVLYAVAYQNDTEVPELGCCVATVAQGYRFAEHAGHPFSVMYAVDFVPNGP